MNRNIYMMLRVNGEIVHLEINTEDPVEPWLVECVKLVADGDGDRGDRAQWKPLDRCGGDYEVVYDDQPFSERWAV